jgi:hypothetical protein
MNDKHPFSCTRTAQRSRLRAPLRPPGARLFFSMPQKPSKTPAIAAICDSLPPLAVKPMNTDSVFFQTRRQFLDVVRCPIHTKSGLLGEGIL